MPALGDDDRAAGHRQRLWRHAPPLIVLLAAALLLVQTSRENAITSDEPYHTVRGLAFWDVRDTRLSYAHPPLINALTALPGAVAYRSDDLASQSSWKTSGKVEDVAGEYYQAGFERARAQTYAARLVMAALTIGLLAYVYHLGVRYMGRWAGLVALVLLAFNPTLLAHGSLNTTDLGAALFFALLAGESFHYVTTRGHAPLWRFALIVSAAFIVKYNLIPFSLLVCVAAAVAATLGRGRFAGLPLGRRLAQGAVEIALVVMVSVAMINAAYRFQGTFWTVERVLHEQRLGAHGHGRALLAETSLARFPAGWIVPVPYTYLYGLAFVAAHNAEGHDQWFRGQPNRFGVIDYFPTLVFLKTPLTVWLFLLAGGISAVVLRRRPSAFTLGIGGFLAVYGVLLLSTSLNLGVRHALPVLPLLSLLAGRGGALLLEALGQRSATLVAPAAVTGLALTIVVSPIAAFPDMLGYFNVLVGRARGHEISMVGEDLGQNVPALARHVQQEGLRPLYYEPYLLVSALELERRGVDFRQIGCGSEIQPEARPAYVALHGTLLVRRPGSCYPWRAHARLHKVIRQHIRIYEIAPRAADLIERTDGQGFRAYRSHVIVPSEDAPVPIAVPRP